MKEAQTPQERKKILLNKIAEKRLNYNNIPIKKMSDLNIVIHEKVYECYKEDRGGMYDE